MNKCIGDDTKAAARQSLNCIKNKNIIKYGGKRFSIWRMEFLHPEMWHDHDIDFARWLQPAIWHVNDVAVESWQWIHQVAALYNVIHGSAMTCHWIRQVAAPCIVAGGSGIEFAQTSAILEFYIWFPFLHITAVDMSFCTSLRNFIQIGPPSEKMTSCRFSRWRISAILDCRIQ